MIYATVSTDHNRCSDFCKVKSSAVSEIQSVESDFDHTPEKEPDDGYHVFENQADMWTEGSSLQAQEEARLGYYKVNLDKDILQDVSIPLDRIASKSDRLLGNVTTNLAECWMHVRSKFDGGKLYNLCNRGSWHTRFYGGSLGSNLGPNWSPLIWQQATGTGTIPGYFFTKLYNPRKNQLHINTEVKKIPNVIQSRWKRKMTSTAESRSKKARMSYGEDAIDVLPDLDHETLQSVQKSFVDKHIDISQQQLAALERLTRQQSTSKTWHDERRKRITASPFGCVVKRNPNLHVTPLVRRLLYGSFKGNAHTRKGLQEERITIQEYVLKKAEEGVNVQVSAMGLVVSSVHKFLAGSPDGKVVEVGGETGLIEIKNLLHSKPINLWQAAQTEKNFCLALVNNELTLKPSHDYFYQWQGLLQVTQLPWIDFIVRTVNPYQLHIERIYRDTNLWTEKMLPKLSSFYYNVLLPELASPREGKSPGIREPGIWYQDTSVARGSRCKSTSKVHRKKPQGTGKRKLSAVKTTTKVTSPTQENDSTSAGFVKRSVRSKCKTKFVGRRISHLWITDESSGKASWYQGNVLAVLSGSDGEPNAEYEILYDGDDEPYAVDNLHKDLKDNHVKFIDL